MNEVEERAAAGESADFPKNSTDIGEESYDLLFKVSIVEALLSIAARY